MKLSISLSDADVAALDEHVRQAGLADVAALDEHVRQAGLPSRSAAVQQAVRALAQQQLEQDYAAAWQDWDDSGDREVWEGATADGLR